MNIIIPINNEKYENYIHRILKLRENKKQEGTYMERHHILPKCLNGKDNSQNLIWLYAEEHYYAHKLLALENPSNNALQLAWWNMCQCTQNGERKYKISAKEYAEARKNFSLLMKGNSYAKGQALSEETKDKMRKAHKGKNTKEKNPMYGKHCSEHSKELIRKKVSGKNNPAAHKVRCIETNQVFNTMKDASTWCGISHSDIAACIAGRQKSAGKHPETKIKLHWEYIE